MLKILLVAATLSLASTPVMAAPCKDAKGRFMKCPPAKPVATKCRLNGKFAKCGTPGAKPA
ncbi:hypothetical protein E2E30_10085 [Sphingomonas sp. AAP5]|uniref:Uncharacterized protein n=1 Tax=Sphingomonas glacialis TaxID=658225 RepID=A0ABQ3LB42_9SPHN|nr:MULTISPECIES: hypothetical protein [Sphingomonas]QBM76077.1 hypothetical protein E2E30_10085 [Sphingomonas sp. AAP5]GHH10836.1 hypothetical protein GCM10008023_09150 [Sphingomonas glacialis]